jgi:hypothetical protein
MTTDRQERAEHYARQALLAWQSRRPTPDAVDGDGLWSRDEVQLQADQAAGQLDVWDVLDDDVSGVCAPGPCICCQPWDLS